MPMRIETRNSVFELKDTRTGTYELKKVEDLSPGGKAKATVGTIWMGNKMFPPKMGVSFILKDGEKEIAKTEPVLKVSGNLAE